jgi:hypothetical protein
MVPLYIPRIVKGLLHGRIAQFLQLFRIAPDSAR